MAKMRERSPAHGRYSQAELTDWISADTPPVRKGVYRVLLKAERYKPVRWYQYWDGQHWCAGAKNAGEANRSVNVPLRFGLQAITHWRGVTEETYKNGMKAIRQQARRQYADWYERFNA